MMKKSFGFTLGEILIALSVIGVVASLVMPQLVNGHKAGEAQAQFNTAYSLIAKAVADMDADNVSINPVSYGGGSFYEQLKKYSRITVDCGRYAATNTSVCFSTTDRDADKSYKRLSKTELTNSEKSLLDDGAFVLNNGMLVMIENSTYGGNVNPPGLLISVDINGKNKNPNMWGYDLFTFELTKDGLLPVGAEGTGQNADAKKLWGKEKPGKHCDLDSDIAYNGITCSYFAVTDQDYFKKLYKGH